MSQRNEEDNWPKAANEQQALEIERLKAQLFAPEEQDKEINEVIFGKYVLPRVFETSQTTSLKLTVDCATALTGHPQEAASSDTKESIAKLEELHELSRRSMKCVFKALWPKETIPE